MNSVKYLLFYMELFCDMFGSVLECYELTHISWSFLIPRPQGVMHEWAGIVTPLVVYSKAPIGAYVVVVQLLTFLNLHFVMNGYFSHISHKKKLI